MDEENLLSDPEPIKPMVPMPPEKVKKWATHKEFENERLITPTAFRRVSGETTNSKYLDKEGMTYHLEFIDHDNNNMPRVYENCYSNFFKDVMAANIKKGLSYKAKVMKLPTGWKWTFILYE